MMPSLGFLDEKRGKRWKEKVAMRVTAFVEGKISIRLVNFIGIAGNIGTLWSIKIGFLSSWGKRFYYSKMETNIICDDCIAISGGTSKVTITGVTCGPGHGISIGSLGHGGFDVVEEINVRNCTFKETMNGVRIKSWQALDKIRFESLMDKSKLNAQPELFIRIVPDKVNKTLSIIDIGIGMTKAVTSRTLKGMANLRKSRSPWNFLYAIGNRWRRGGIAWTCFIASNAHG